jgi:hypothetical protein
MVRTDADFKAGVNRRDFQEDGLSRVEPCAVGHSGPGWGRLASPYRSDDASVRGAKTMTRTKLSSLVLSALLMAPVAYALMAQAAQIVA